MLDSVIRANKKYYPPTLLKECKYEIEKEQNGEPYDDLDQSLSDESDSESDNELDNDESNDESDND